MNKPLALLLAAVLFSISTPALAELQNVQVGGEIQIRGNYYSNVLSENGTVAWPAPWVRGRPLGTRGGSILSGFAWDDESNTDKSIEQRTRLNVKADFTNDVSMFIELDAWNLWGDTRQGPAFRSNYITGSDSSNSVSDVQVYQAYIEANDMWGMPLRMRIGRQELSFGSEWLVGVNDTASGIWGLSFDAVRLTYATDMYSLDLVAAKLMENGIVEEDGDVDMYAVYGSYLGFEDITVDAYYIMVRDARSINDTNFVWWAEGLEDLATNLDLFGSFDDYDVTTLNTIGLRGAGAIGAFDFELEAAYQFGDADRVGSFFRPFVYGDDEAEFDAWGVNAEVGYTFDTRMQPRVYLGYAYFSGEDNRDISWWQWATPWTNYDASVSFNRLFSNWEYTEFFANTDLSNVHIFRGGVSAMPTESLELLVSLNYYVADEEFDSPYYVDLGGFRIPVVPVRSYATMANDDELGWELGIYATYNYSEDLTFEAGWAHLFTGDGLTDGAFVAGNGLFFTAGTDDDDADYFFIETSLAF